VTDPEGQFFSPYLGMSNNPLNGTDPNGGYFFGLFGSTREQRHAAKEFAALTGGEVYNITSSKKIGVSYQMGISFDNEGVPIIMKNTLNFSFYGNDHILTKVHDEQMGLAKLGLGPAPGTVDFDPLTQLSLGFLVAGTPAMGVRAASAIGEINLPVYRVFGEGSRVFGKSWTPLLNPSIYGKYYRGLAGLPNANSGTFMVKGFVKIKDIHRFRMALPLDGNFGRLVPEAIINNASSSVRLSTFRVIKP
jgi:hypothetical protein